MPVFVTRRAPASARVTARRVQRIATRMLEHLALEQFELSILLCDDPAITELNRRHRKLNKATDVLAFPLFDGAPRRFAPGAPRRFAPGALGDVVISIDTASRQARKRRHPLLTEVSFLLAHGLLHLMGYDHRTKKEEAVMNGKCDELMAQAGPKARVRPRKR